MLCFDEGGNEVFVALSFRWLRLREGAFEYFAQLFHLVAIKERLHLDRDRVNSGRMHGFLVSVTVCFNELTFALTNVIICLLKFE